MTSDLRDALQRRADALEVADLDVADLVARGEQRIRRRRFGAAVGAGILAFAVAAGMVLLLDADSRRRADPVHPSPTDGRTAGPDVGSTRPIVWAVEPGPDPHRVPARIHVGDRSVRVEAIVARLQATDDGVAYLTSAPGPFSDVWFTDGRTVTRLGRTGDAGIRGDEIMKSAVVGSSLAWVDHSSSSPDQVVLYDTRRMEEVARTPLGAVPGCGAEWPYDPLNSCVTVVAVRDQIVYVAARTGDYLGGFAANPSLLAYDMTTGQRRTVTRDEFVEGFRGTPRTLVVGDSLESGEVTPGVGVFLDVQHGVLVKARDRRPPSSSSLVGANGRTVVSFALPATYPHGATFVISQWVDDDGFVIWSNDYAELETGRGGLLLCRLSTARCEVAVRAPAGTRYQVAPEAVLA